MRIQLGRDADVALASRPAGLSPPGRMGESTDGRCPPGHHQYLQAPLCRQRKSCAKVKVPWETYHLLSFPIQPGFLPWFSDRA